MQIQKLFFAVGGILLSLAVGLGAYGAHARLVNEKIWMTAWHLHLVHSLGLLIVTFVLQNRVILVGTLHLFGLLCFCGSLYFQALGMTERSPLAPLGGSAWILSWLLFSWLCLRRS